MVDDDIERMLNNWAMYKVGSGIGSLDYATTDLSLVGRSTRSETAMPVINGEAMDVDTIIRALPFDQSQVLHARYLRELQLDRASTASAGVRLTNQRIPPSYTTAQVARQLRISEDTYLRRIKIAKRSVINSYMEIRQRNRIMGS